MTMTAMEPTARRVMDDEETAEETLAAAAAAWRAARARLDGVDPGALGTEDRAAWFRLLARIGLWADARSLGETEDKDDEPDDEAPGRC